MKLATSHPAQPSPAEDVARLLEQSDALVLHASWQQLAERVERVDCLIVDAPYSKRTHSAYRDMATVGRESIAYAHWTVADVEAFVSRWSPKTTGWMVSITDSVLAPVWAAAFDASGRYAFSPLSCVEPGSRVRVSGDGPSQWSCFAVVARPRSREFVKWGTLPGAYVTPSGQPRARGSSQVVGGKSSWLMERLVEDYSRPGDLVCDPCAGGGTTLTAALRTGRRAIGCDIDPKHAQMAADACRTAQRPLIVERKEAEQLDLIGGPAMRQRDRFELWWAQRCAEQDGEQMTYGEIGAVLGMDESSVRHVEARALEKMRERLEALEVEL